MTVEDIRGYMNLLEGKEEKLTLSPLPFEIGDLSPVLSKDNIDYHYNVLSKGYVDRWKSAITPEAQKMSLIAITQTCWRWRPKATF